jgi:GAF domain-containing protein
MEAVEWGASHSRYRPSGARTTLFAPLCRADVAIGVLIIRRREVRAFTDDQVALVESFAEMAALAIENARLKDEAEALKDEAESRSAEL